MMLAPHSETIVWAALSIWKKRALVKWLRDSSLNQLIIHTTCKNWVFWLQVLIAAYAPWRFYHYNCNHWWSAYDLRDCEFKSDVAKCIQESMKTFWFVPKVPRPSVVSKHRFAATSTSRALGQGDFACRKWLDGIKIRWKAHYFWRTSLTTTEIEKNSESGAISYLKSTNKTFICVWFNFLETGNIEIGFRVFLTSISHIRQLRCQVAKVGPLKVLSARQQPNLSPNSDFGDTKE